MIIKPVHAWAAIAFVLAALASSAASAACTREQAFNRMMALNQYGMKLQSDLPDPLSDPQGYNAKYPRVTDFNTRLASVGKTLAAQKYDDACASYDALAKEYGVDLAAQGVRQLSAIESEARHSPKTGCDLAEASRRSMWLTQSFQKKAQDEHLGRDDWQAFGKQTEPVGPLMQKDPDKACALIDSIARQYGLQR
ncbi:MAG TPA: hypothetical protein VFL07_10230 [Rudaea sp.]|nr:hypothetical protein [Rudaea sp.]